MSGRLAVTGANGFVGRHLIALASAEGVDVVAVVRSHAAAEAVRRHGAQPAVVPGLLAEPLAAAFAGAQAVVHLAQIGAEHPGESYETVNVAGSRAVAEAAAVAGVARVVMMSGLGVAHFGQLRRCTNAYFLSKLCAEVELYRSRLEVSVFRPSYVVGPGDGLVPAVLKGAAAGELEVPGDGSYRMQPIAARDAVAALLAASFTPSQQEPWRVLDLVGPEPVSYLELLRRIADRARLQGWRGTLRVREVPVEAADLRARAPEGFHGMRADELDCLLCDEVANPRPLEALLGRFLTPLDASLDLAVRAALPAGRDPQ